MNFLIKPVVMEVRKGNVDSLHFSLYNFPLIEILRLLRCDLQAQYISVCGFEKCQEDLEKTFLIDISMKELIYIVEGWNKNNLQISIILSNHWKIESNFEDELYIEVQDRSDLDILVRDVLRSMKVHPARIFGNYYCCEIQEGVMTHYSTMENYLKHFACKMVKV